MKEEKAEKIYCLMNCIYKYRNKLEKFHYNTTTHFEAVFRDDSSVKISDFELRGILDNAIKNYYEKELKRLESELNEN